MKTGLTEADNLQQAKARALAVLEENRKLQHYLRLLGARYYAICEAAAGIEYVVREIEKRLDADGEA